MTNHSAYVVTFVFLLQFHSSARNLKFCPDCSDEAFVDGVISSDPPIGGCMAMSKRNSQGNGVLNRRNRSTVGRHTERIWNKNRVCHNYIVPYAITSKYNTSQLARIKGAISEIEKKTCIKFKLIDDKAMADYYKDKSHVEIKSVQGGGCHSVIGRKPGKNMVKLEIRTTATKTCIAHHVIIHEILHLLRLYHEHQRPDRDEFITIHKLNVMKDRIANFNIARKAETFRLPYDYCRFFGKHNLTIGVLETSHHHMHKKPQSGVNKHKLQIKPPAKLLNKSKIVRQAPHHLHPKAEENKEDNAPNTNTQDGNMVKDKNESENHA